MRVGVNTRVLRKPTPTGVARYAVNLLTTADSAAPADVTYSLFGVEELPDALPAGGRLHARGGSPPANSGLRAHIWEQVQLPRTLDDDLDVFHTPAGQPPLVASVPLVTTIHDVSPITHPEWFSTPYAALYRILTPLAIRASDRVLTVSEFSRDEIVRTCPAAAGKTIAVPNGVRPRDPSGGIPVEGLDTGEFLLFVGANNPRKNIETLIGAYREYRRRASSPVDLALAGPNNDVFAELNLPTVEGVRTLGFVSDDELTWLYHNAAAFVFPSLYEGFGLPILEAMSAATPVITSDRGAMAEVAGDAARLVDPTDRPAIADAIDRVIADEEYAAALSQAGTRRASEFRWERTVDGTIAAYRDAVDG